MLPSEQTAAQIEALRILLYDGSAQMAQPCDCGSQIRHNNGGNYHETIEMRMDSGSVFRRFTTTYE